MGLSIKKNLLMNFVIRNVFRGIIAYELNHLPGALHLVDNISIHIWYTLKDRLQVANLCKKNLYFELKMQNSF